MRIYTRTGDEGQTGLIGGARVSKTDARIVAIGEVDELNASIGVARAGSSFESKLLDLVQSALFNLGSELAAPSDEEMKIEGPSPDLIARLEESIDAQTDRLPKLRNFILPGGCELAARFHLARSVCRRAERAVLNLHVESPVSAESRQFLNRLSDWLFVAARSANAAAGIEDVVWRGTEG